MQVQRLQSSEMVGLGVSNQHPCVASSELLLGRLAHEVVDFNATISDAFDLGKEDNVQWILRTDGAAKVHAYVSFLSCVRG